MIEEQKQLAANQSFLPPAALHIAERLAHGGAQGPQHPPRENLEWIAKGKTAYLPNLERIAENKKACLENSIEVGQKEIDRLRILLEDHNARFPARSAQPCEDPSGQQPDEDSQPNGIRPGTGKDPLELRKDTPGIGEVEHAVFPRSEWPQVDENPVTAADRYSSPAAQAGPVPESTATKQSTPDEQAFPAEPSQQDPVEQSGPVPQSTAVERSTPVDELFPQIGPPHVRLPFQGSNEHTYLLSEPQEESPPSTQEAQTTQLNPDTPSFEATQIADVAQSVLAKQLNPAAQSFEATITRSILARQLNPAAQPFPATPPVVATQENSATQSIPVAQAVPATPPIRATQPTSTTWSHLAQELESRFTLTEYNIFRRKDWGPLTAKAYQSLNYGGLGRSAPKGEAFCKSLFRWEPIPPPQPVFQQPSDTREQALSCISEPTDDGFSLPPPAFSRPSTPNEQTPAQPVTEELFPEQPVLAKELWVVQQPNGRTPADLVETMPGSSTCASAATREARTDDDESSTPVDERRDKRAVLREIRALKSWRKE